MLCERLAERIAVLLSAKLRQNRHDQRTAAEFEAKVFEEIGFDGHTVHHPLYGIHCMAYSMGCQVFFKNAAAERTKGAESLITKREKAAGLRGLRPALVFAMWRACNGRGSGVLRGSLRGAKKWEDICCFLRGSII